MTPRGRTLLALAVGMLVFGKLLGMRELMMAGAAAGIVLLLGSAAVWLRSASITVRRDIRPSTTSVGRGARVELVLRASGRLGTGPVLISDRLPPRLGQGVQLTIASNRQRERAVAYTIKPKLRGRYQIGPIEVTYTDPFGAVQRRRTAPGRSTLTVYPSYEEISILPSASHRMGVVRHSPLVGTGDEFYALRPYEEGDDLRKVHWASALRTGQLVIRQEELLAEPRALIVLDTCRSKHAGRGRRASIEAAVSACASVAVCALRNRMRIEIVTSDGVLLATRTPSEHQLLEALAMLPTSELPEMTTGLRTLSGGRLAFAVVITPGLAPDEAKAIALATRRAASGVTVLVDTRSFAPTTRRHLIAPDAPSIVGFPTLHLGADDSFKHVWHTRIADVALAR